MNEPRDAASSGEQAEAHGAVEPVTPGQWGTFRTHADQRRLAQVQAAKREREAARARADASLRLEAEEPETRPARASRDDANPAVDDAQSRVRDEALRLGVGMSHAPAVTWDDGLELPGEPAAKAPTNVSETFTILVVCTGNVCRSPYFERVLAADLAGLPVRVEGAGTGALLIDRMSSGSQALLRGRSLDGAHYRPRQVTPALAREADLVLTASREHRHVLIEEAPTAAARVFALLDFADVCAEAPVPATRGIDGLREFVANSPAGSVERHSARSDAEAEILDPFRQGPEVFARMAAQADPALATVAGTISRILG